MSDEYEDYWSPYENIGLDYNPEEWTSFDSPINSVTSWDQIVAPEEMQDFQNWLQENYPSYTDQTVNQQVFNATGGNDIEQLPGINSMYDFNAGEYAPAVVDANGNLVLASDIGGTSGSGFNWSKLSPSGSTLANLAGALLGGYAGNLGYQQSLENVQNFNNANRDSFMRIAAGIIPEAYMPTPTDSKGRLMTNPDGSPLTRAAGGQSTFMQRPDIQAIISNHDRLRSTPAGKYASGGKTGALGAIRQDKVAQRYLGGYKGGGQDDNLVAAVSPNEYVMDADVVAALGDGSPDEGARKLDKMRENIRQHKRSAPKNKIPPKAKSPEQYMKGAK